MRITAAEFTALRCGPSRSRPAGGRREGDVSRAVVAYLATRPDVHVRRNNTGAVTVPATATTRSRHVRFSVKGAPDFEGWITVTCPCGKYTMCTACGGTGRIARVLGIEVKAPGKKPKPHQQAYLDSITAGGGLAIVAWNVQDVVKGLGG